MGISEVSRGRTSTDNYWKDQHDAEIPDKNLVISPCLIPRWNTSNTFRPEGGYTI